MSSKKKAIHIVPLDTSKPFLVTIECVLAYQAPVVGINMTDMGPEVVGPKMVHDVFVGTAMFTVAETWLRENHPEIYKEFRERVSAGCETLLTGDLDKIKVFLGDAGQTFSVTDEPSTSKHDDEKMF